MKPRTVRVPTSLLPSFGLGDLPTVSISGAIAGAATTAAAVAVGIGGLTISGGTAGGIPARDGKPTDVDMAARDYTIIVDRSGSMEGSRWSEAAEAVKIIAPRVCEFDADGISLYFFSSRFQKIENVKTAEEVTRHFMDHCPSGGTALAEVLQDAVAPDNFVISKSGKHKHRKPETILIVTDGVPDNKEKVEKVIVDAANGIDEDQELSITVIQVGNDKSAAKWLAQLDDTLQHGSSKAGTAKFDIVDVLSVENLKNMNFAELIRMSICD